LPEAEVQSKDDEKEGDLGGQALGGTVTHEFRKGEEEGGLKSYHKGRRARMEGTHRKGKTYVARRRKKGGRAVAGGKAQRLGKSEGWLACDF